MSLYNLGDIKLHASRAMRPWKERKKLIKAAKLRAQCFVFLVEMSLYNMRDIKLHASRVVNLCKERNKFIKAAKYCPNDLVTSIELYLESFLELGNVLNQYVEQELVILYDSCVPDFDPSKEEDSKLKFSSSDSDSDSDFHSSCRDFHGEDEEQGGLHDDMEEQDEFNTYKYHSQHNNQENTHNNIHVAMSHEDHLGQHDSAPMMSFGNGCETPQSGHWVFQHVNKDSEFQNHGTEQNNHATVLPTPQLPKAGDYLHCYDENVREVREREAWEREARERQVREREAWEREVRKREGIPDLEDASVKSSTMSAFDQNVMESGMRYGSGNGTYIVTELNANEDALSTEHEEETEPNLEPEVGEVVGSEAEETKEECSECLGTTPVASSGMNLKEAVLEIKNEFEYLFECRKEFPSVINVGKKLTHHSGSTKLRAFASCVLEFIIPTVQKCLCPSHKLYQPASRARSHMLNNQEHVCTTFDDLSSTLDRLYVWEKKLYGEVMVEEKLGIPYDKLCKRLEELNNRGSDSSESDKIDYTLASIRRLQTEVNVVVASICKTSREINDLRDNKLLPELNELIEGLIRLWKAMCTCHLKQFQAIKKAKGHVQIFGPEIRKKSSSKATRRLERVILNCGMCFINFIKTQKAFVKHLNDWLLRHIFQEAEETEDGIGPSLPSDIGAPPIFRVCNNWYHAIDKLSEIGVSQAISNFSSSLHHLYEKQEEEKALKVRVKHHLKDYQHKLQSFCKKNGIKSRHCLSFIKIKALEDFVHTEIPLPKVYDDNLKTSQKRLVQLKKIHQEFIIHVNDIDSSFFQEGLTHIFEALASFCLDNLEIYEQLRLQNAATSENVACRQWHSCQSSCEGSIGGIHDGLLFSESEDGGV